MEKETRSFRRVQPRVADRVGELELRLVSPGADAEKIGIIRYEVMDDAGRLDSDAALLEGHVSEETLRDLWDLLDSLRVKVEREALPVPGDEIKEEKESTRP